MSRDSLELEYALDTIAKAKLALVPLERGYTAQDLDHAMQQMLAAIIALSAWAARQERG